MLALQFIYRGYCSENLLSSIRGRYVKKSESIVLVSSRWMVMKRKIIIAFDVAVFVFALLTFSVFSALSPASVYSEKADFQSNLGSKKFISPVIYHPDEIDQDFDGIIDSLEAYITQMTVINESALVPIIVTLYNPVEERDLNIFSALGGKVTYVYRHVTYGFAGVIPGANITTFASLEGESLVVIEPDAPIEYHLDVSVPLIRARPVVWDTYGYMGSANYSIAILDTGIDDSHPDVGPYGDLNFSKKMVGWYDATPYMAAEPQDYGEHGTHVAGIAAGNGTANSLQGSGTLETTFAYALPERYYGYIDFIDVMNPGVIKLNCSWAGFNRVLLRLRDPYGVTVDEIDGLTSPLILTYNTEGTLYPTGRYQVIVYNLLGSKGNPFSCIETYQYEGINDGYNLFTGVAPNSKLVGVKVFDNTGIGNTAYLMNGMDWIIENKLQYHIVVASMSLSLIDGATDSTLDQKVDTMVRNGIVTTVSAGNDYPEYTIGSPGTAAYVITIAATNDLNGVTSYSSNGDTGKNEYGLVKPDVVAPGGTFQLDPAYGNKIVSADSNDEDGGYTGYADQNVDDYQQMGGTSMSTPHVAGLAALTIQALGGWNWTEDEALKVKMLICMTAFETQSGEGTNVPPLDRGEKDSKEGYGRICADAAIEAATMTYAVGELASDVLGSDPSGKKVWARQVWLSAGIEYDFSLSVPSGADYDLYVYNGEPDSYGQPVILKKSVNASVGAEEAITYTPTNSGTYYIVIKWVSGSGNFELESGPRHDVAIVSVVPSATQVYVGEIVNITVIAENEGDFTETFNVTAKYDNTTIATQTVTDLSPDANITLTFSWNTTDVAPCINYAIMANATTIPDETDVVDNVYIDGTVKVNLQGDVNGDGVVDIWDLAKVGKAYGTFEGEPDYDPEADITKDGIVDMRDIAIVAVNYGNSC